MKFFILFFTLIAIALVNGEYDNEGEHGLGNGQRGFNQAGHGQGHGQGFNQGDHVGHGQQAIGQHGRHGY
ncbi:hypothetical protein ACLKA6_009449 [Drosophila palustris]